VIRPYGFSEQIRHVTKEEPSERVIHPVMEMDGTVNVII